MAAILRQTLINGQFLLVSVLLTALENKYNIFIMQPNEIYSKKSPSLDKTSNFKHTIPIHNCDKNILRYMETTHHKKIYYLYPFTDS